MSRYEIMYMEYPFTARYCSLIKEPLAEGVNKGPVDVMRLYMYDEHLKHEAEMAYFRSLEDVRV